MTPAGRTRAFADPGARVLFAFSLETTMSKKFQYTVTFQIETSRKLKKEGLEDLIADVWDGRKELNKKIVVDSYGFEIKEAGEW